MTESVRLNREFTLPAAAATACMCALFGGNVVAIKLSLTGIGVFTCACIRFTIASVAVTIWARATGRPFRITRRQIPQILIISAIFTCQLSLFYTGIGLTYASRATLLVNLQPFFVMLLAHVFIPEDRITPRKFAGMLLAFAGIAVLLGENRHLVGQIRSGDFFIMGATVFWAVSAVYVKRVIADFQAFHMVLYPMLVAVPVLLMEALLWDPEMIFRLDSTVIAAMAYQGLVTAGFGFVVWNHMLQRYGTVAVHSFLFILPVTGVWFSGWILNEPITPNVVVSMLLVVVGLLVVHFRQRRPVPAMISAGVASVSRSGESTPRDDNAPSDR